MDLFGQHAGDFVRGHHRGERAAVADAFGHRHDVRDDTLCFEAPEMGPGAAKAGLDFVRDAEAAGSTDVLVRLLEVTFRKYDGAADALNGFGDESGDAAGGGEIDQLFDI